MPFEADGDQRRSVQADVRPSSVLELTWLLHLLQWERFDDIDALRERGPRARRELTAIFDDDHESLPDVSILAERIGALLTDEADTFLDGLVPAARRGGV